MVEKALNIHGTKKFAYKCSGPITRKQEFIISTIEIAYKDYGVKFKGSNSRQAYNFIQNYYGRVHYNKQTQLVSLRNEQGIIIPKGYLKLK